MTPPTQQAPKGRKMGKFQQEHKEKYEKIQQKIKHLIEKEKEEKEKEDLRETLNDLDTIYYGQEDTVQRIEQLLEGFQLANTPPKAYPSYAQVAARNSFPPMDPNPPQHHPTPPLTITTTHTHNPQRH